MEKPLLEGGACGGRAGKINDQRTGPGAGGNGVPLGLQQRCQAGVIGAQRIHADRSFGLAVKGGCQRKGLCPELRIEQLRNRAGQAVVDRKPLQRVRKIAFRNSSPGSAAQNSVDHAGSAGFAQRPGQLDRFIDGGGQRHIHIPRLRQACTQYGTHRRIQLGDGLFCELV